MKYDVDDFGGWDTPLPGEHVTTAPAAEPTPQPEDSAPRQPDEELPYQLDSAGEPEPELSDENDGDEGDLIGNPVAPGGFVPADTADRPIDPGMRSRYAGHSEYNDMVRDDWIMAVQLDPDAFDALVYRARIHQPDSNEAVFTPKVTDVYDPNQALLDYDKPEQVVVLDCPDEMETFMAMFDNSDNASGGMDALILRTTGLHIPVGSVFEWQEELTHGRYRRCWWYVQRIFNYGTASVGSLFYCVPFRSMEGLENAE